MSCIDIAIEVTEGNQIDGAYLEFGAYKGDSIVYANKVYQDKGFSAARFIAFDSFGGLPESDEEYKPDQYSEGQYCATLGEFNKNTKGIWGDAVPGFFKGTLNDRTKKKYNINKVRIAYIDCDLYESAKDVFNFLTDIVQDGSVIVIDDWFRHRGTPNYGIQKACNEWLRLNPQIELIHLHCYKRIAFIVHIKDGKT